MVWYNIMSIFGRKFAHFAHKAGRKLHVKDIKKFGTKALHATDRGLNIAHKVVGGANKVIKKAISGVLMVVWKSRCSNINCGYGCISCDRDPLPPPKNNDVRLEMETFNDATNI